MASQLSLNYTNSKYLAQFNSNNSIGSFTILELIHDKQQAIVAFCFNGTDITVDCKPDQLDLFVWSKKPLNTLTSIDKNEVVSLLKNYCITNESSIVFSDMHQDACSFKNKNSTEETENTEPLLIAELKLTDMSATLNETNSLHLAELDLASLNSSFRLNFSKEFSNFTNSALDVVIDFGEYFNNETTTPAIVNATHEEELASNSTNTTVIVATTTLVTYSLNQSLTTNLTSNETFLDTGLVVLLNKTADPNVTLTTASPLLLNLTLAILESVNNSTVFSANLVENSTNSSPMLNETNAQKSENITNEFDDKVRFTSHDLDEESSEVKDTLVSNLNETDTTTEPALIVFKKDKVFLEDHSAEYQNNKENTVASVLTSTFPVETTVGVLDKEVSQVKDDEELPPLSTESLHLFTSSVSVEKSTVPSRIDTLEALERLEMEVNQNATEEILAEDMSKELVLRDKSDDSSETTESTEIMATSEEKLDDKIESTTEEPQEDTEIEEEEENTTETSMSKSVAVETTASSSSSSSSSTEKIENEGDVEESSQETEENSSGKEEENNDELEDSPKEEEEEEIEKSEEG